MRDRAGRRHHLILAPMIERRSRRLSAVDLFLRQMTAGLGRFIPSSGNHAARLDRIEVMGTSIRSAGDSALAASARALRSRLLRSDVSGAPLEEAFAIVRELSHRLLGLRHHRVQLMGGLILADGGLAEMQTGEGKTITALLPAVAYALSGRPVHVVTVNDYLARRDGERLRPVYEALGLSVGIVQSGQSVASRRDAYAADVTYCTNKDLVFDYLRDRLALRQTPSEAPGSDSRGKASAERLLRGLSFAIVDEADSVLIDEAQTPLIIAGERPSDGSSASFATALDVASTLVEGRHFRISAAGRQIELEDRGRELLATVADRFEGVWRSPSASEELARHALSALHLYHRDRHYIVTNDKVQIVDEFTGRVMADRTWQYGLHQMIETKEGLVPSGQHDTLAQITYQRFFRRYVRLAGMSGTVREAAGELLAVYGLRLHVVPTHRPSRRRNLGTKISRTANEKWLEVALAAERETAVGRAVLIGTRSVAASEAVSAILTARGTSHVVLNARQDKAEAEAIGSAGAPGRITVATNMAGRGTDIHLSPEVAARGGLHVILTEFHESGRIDRQLIGRAGRQGDPGSFETIASLDDELFVRFAPVTTHVMAAGSRILPAVVAAFAPRTLAQAQAERRGRRVRRQVVRRDQDLDRSFFFSGSPD